ncbi:MAG: Smr/MutS family protein, partial [Anaerolineales bacterium]|nr:Smr/MutS family protein [Anaerolineales bacterium]
QSGSGATVWVEPMQTVELNNEFRSLQIEEEKEIHRILSALTVKVADQGDVIIRIVDRIAEFDLIFARAKYAGDINAIEPEFVPWRKNKGGDRHPGCNVWVKGARHPLLDPSTVIPTDLTLPEDVFMVLITGPNTGGKTVSLKTLGLMVLMAQSGMHLPATEARLTIFNDVFADIGDEQSIEQSLSTFSGHMTNITRILAEVDERTLVLLDELGSGTDPAEGAALAQSIIEFLRDKGTTTFTATHYPELKAYATRTEGATNASLIFDIDTLSPTYEMTIGIPGKSNALAIARRLGLDDSILDDALRLLGTESSETETLLDSIYDMREKISSEEAAIRLERKRIERDRKKLEQQLSDIEPERQRIVEETRAQMAAELDEVRREIQQVRRRLSDAQSKNTLKQLSRNVQEIEEQPREKMELSPIVEPAEPARKRKLKVGDTVLVKTINTKGDVLSIDGDEVSVAIGRLHLKAKLDELEFKGRPVSNEEPLSNTVSVPRAESPGLELDIRGRRVEDGLSELDKYLDRAFLARMPWVRIIHGKGTGKLRQAVRKALSKHNRILSWEEGLDGEGGAGVTVAKLEEVPQES